MTPNEIRADLPGRMAVLEISASDLARLADWPVSSLANFLAGRRTPPVDELQRLHHLVTDLEQLCSIIAAPIKFSNVVAVRGLLSELSKGCLSAENPARMGAIVKALNLREKDEL